MQSVSRTAPVARAPPLSVRRALGASERCWLRMGRAGGRAPTTALRARCGGGPESVEARKEDGGVLGGEEEEEAVLLAPEELEMLEDEAMGGGDEGRRPTDYDRRAHIFEESSRVFQALKQRRDGDGDDVEAGAAAATAETTRDRHEQLCME